VRDWKRVSLDFATRRFSAASVSVGSIRNASSYWIMACEVLPSRRSKLPRLLWYRHARIEAGRFEIMRFSFFANHFGQERRRQLRMRIGQIRIDLQGALILRDCRIEFASFVEKGAVGVEQARG